MCLSLCKQSSKQSSIVATFLSFFVQGGRRLELDREYSLPNYTIPVPHSIHTSFLDDYSNLVVLVLSLYLFAQNVSIVFRDCILGIVVVSGMMAVLW